MHGSGVSHVILGALRNEPRSGYEIKRLVDNATRFFWAASYGQIYPELRRLRRDGLIEAVDESAGTRRRTRYRLTPAGRAELVRWLQEPIAGYELRDEGLLKLFFADALGRDEAVALVRSFKAAREAILERLREIERTIAPAGFPGVVLAYGIEFHEWGLEWAARLERRLQRSAAQREATR
jgi:DNA-binding PadR family transcriptional regulator